MSVVYSIVGTKGGVSKTTVAMGLSIWISVVNCPPINWEACNYA
jgi:MinD superfamily P-loop ATPase